MSVVVLWTSPNTGVEQVSQELTEDQAKNLAANLALATNARVVPVKRVPDALTLDLSADD